MANLNDSRQLLNGLALKKAVDAACDEFEAAWTARKQPSIERYLELQPPPVRGAFLRELLMIELALEPPGDAAAARAKYAARFPQHQDTVAEVFARHPPRAAGGPAANQDATRGEMIRVVQARLEGPENRLADHGFQARSAKELWRLIVQLAGPAEDEAAPGAIADDVDRLEGIVRQFLDAYPPLRRDILKSLLLGGGLAETAARHGVTERTVAVTHQTATDLLAGCQPG